LQRASNAAEPTQPGFNVVDLHVPQYSLTSVILIERPFNLTFHTLASITRQQISYECSLPTLYKQMTLLYSSVLKWMALAVIAFGMKSYLLCFIFKGIPLLVTMRGSWWTVKDLLFGLILNNSLHPKEHSDSPTLCYHLSATGTWNHYMLMKRVDDELAWEHLSEEQRAGYDENEGLSSTSRTLGRALEYRG